MHGANDEYVKVSDTKTVNMEQQQQPQYPQNVVYTQQPHAVHTTVLASDPSETNALLLLIFGTICCPILCCVNVCLYRKYPFKSGTR